MSDPRERQLVDCPVCDGEGHIDKCFDQYDEVFRTMADTGEMIKTFEIDTLSVSGHVEVKKRRKPAPPPTSLLIQGVRVSRGDILIIIAVIFPLAFLLDWIYRTCCK